MTDENDQIMFVSMRDKKICNFVSNIYGSDTAKSSNGKELPRMVVSYNYGMHGIDIFDRHCSAHKMCPHRQVSWKKGNVFGVNQDDRDQRLYLVQAGKQDARIISKAEIYWPDLPSRLASCARTSMI